MLVDKLMGAVERHLPQYRRLLREARLFRMLEGEAGEGPRTYPGIELANFRLPFEVVCVESCEERDASGSTTTVLVQVGDPDDRRFRALTAMPATRANAELTISDLTVVCFEGVEEDAEIDFEGMFRYGYRVEQASYYSYCARRGFKPIELEREALATLSRSATLREEIEADMSINADLHKGWRASVEELRQDHPEFPSFDDNNSDDDITEHMQRALALVAEGKLAQAVLDEARARADRQIVVFRERVKSAVRTINHLIAQEHGVCVMQALGQILTINHPGHFILSETPLRTGKTKPGSLVRSPWRPHYIVLKPNEIRKRLALPSPEAPAGKRAPHERRGHWRCFRSEHFKEARGRRTWIKAHWIGPREAVRGPNRYVVELGL